MPEKFDPYHKWLGIRPEEQPINHYRLLGLTLFEDDPDTIAHAADQRMGHVRSFQTGSHAALSQQILNELAAARVCLLNSEKKTQYDQTLRIVEQSGFPDVFSTPLYKKHKKSTPAWMPWVFVGIGGLAVVIIWTIIANSGRDEQKIAKGPATSITPPAKTKWKPAIYNVDIDPPYATLTVKDNSGVITGTGKQRQIRIDHRPSSGNVVIEAFCYGCKSSEQRFAPAAGNIVDVKIHLEKRPEATVNTKEPAEPKPIRLEDPKPPPDVEPPTIDSGPVQPATQTQLKPESKARRPVPDAAAQISAMRIIRERYKDDYNKDKTALAEKLIQKTKETHDATEQFMLLREATNLATEAFRGELAFAAIDEIARRYAVSPSQMKLVVIQNAIERGGTNEQKRAIAEAALIIVDEAISEDNYDVARQLIEQAKHVPQQSKFTAKKKKEVEAAAKAYIVAQKAMVTLTEKPYDPDANLAVGKYQCFYKDDWDKGLPMLVKGSNFKLQSLAEKDMHELSVPKDQVQLGDLWWGVSEERAVFWYRKARSKLLDKEKERVDKKIYKGAKSFCLSDLQAKEVNVNENDIHRKAVFNGMTSPSTLWAHPPASNSSSHIAYQLDKQFYCLRGNVGIEDGFSAATSLTFKIIGDGRVLWKSHPIQTSSQSFRINVASVQKLELVVDCPGFWAACHALWIDPVVKR